MTARSALIRSLPCIACQSKGYIQMQRSEAHHLNAGGHAGQKRRGDAYQVALCAWHHRAAVPPHFTAGEMEALLGPSLARNSREFRRVFGSDDYLLALTNERAKGVA